MPEEAIKFSGGDLRFFSVRMSANFGKSIFLVNYNCDASYDHLWCPNGPEVNRKWTGSDRRWARSGLEVSICPSVRLSIPNTSLTSLTNLMRGIYRVTQVKLWLFKSVILWNGKIKVRLQNKFIKLAIWIFQKRVQKNLKTLFWACKRTL